MHNLLSKSLSGRWQKGISRRDEADLEAADMNGINTLGGFFEEVGGVKTQLQGMKQLVCKVYEESEEAKTVVEVEAIKALRVGMDKDVEEILRKAKLIKGMLEELDRGNIENCRIVGCEEGTSINRIRICLTNSARKNFKELMGNFQLLRQKIMSEYRESIDTRYYSLTGEHADEETIDRMLVTGENETLLQKALQIRDRGQILETIKEIQERHDAVKDIEKNLLALHQIFLDMSVLVEGQGEELD
eukprot:c34921_g1_i1 orf=168-905(+)